MCVLLASDAVHYYEEYERGMPTAVLTDLAGMYAAFDTIGDLVAERRTLVPGHDPKVSDRFPRFKGQRQRLRLGWPEHGGLIDEERRRRK